MTSKTENLLLISIKPQYARKIFDGKKTIELRKSSPKRAGENSFMLIYVTISMVKCLLFLVCLVVDRNKCWATSNMQVAVISRNITCNV